MSKKVAKIGIFVALAMIFGYIEAIIPLNFGVPGVKLGVANIVTVVALYVFSKKEAVIISVGRILLTGLLFGNTLSMVYSLAGGLLSLMGMLLLMNIKDVSAVGVSVVGGVLHNVGQLAIAMLMLKTVQLGYYFPVLLLAGILNGFIIGIVSERLSVIIKKTNLASNNNSHE